MNAQTNSRRHDIVRGSLWTLLATTVSLPLAISVNVAIAHFLGPTGLGRLATLIAVMSVATTVTNLGVSQATVQWVAETRELDETDYRFDRIRECIGFHVFLAGPMLATVIFLFLESNGTALALTAAGAAWMTQAVGTSSVILTAMARNASAARLSMLANLALQATTILAAGITRSAPETFVAQTIASIGGPALCFLVLSPQEKACFRRPKVLIPGRDFARYSVSACGGALVALLVFGRSEIFVLQANGLAEAAGYFALATGLASQITVVMDSFMGPLLPNVVAILAVARHRASELVQRALRVSCLLGALTIAVVVPSAASALPILFGERFTAALPAFLFLGVVSCLQSAIQPLQVFALASRNAGAVLRVNLACLVVDAVIALGLVPIIGLGGAVLANATAQLCSLVLLAVTVVRRLDVGTKVLLAACRPLLAGGVSMLVVTLLFQLTDFPGWPVVIAKAVAGAAVMALCLRLRPSYRLSTQDDTAIRRSMPHVLRLLYERSSAVLCLVDDRRVLAAPTEGTSSASTP